MSIRETVVHHGIGKFHKLQEMQPVMLKVLRWEERDKRLIIKEAQLVA